MDFPTTWTPQELEEAARKSLSMFVEERLQQGSAPYREVFPRRATNSKRSLRLRTMCAVSTPMCFKTVRNWWRPPAISGPRL